MSNDNISEMLTCISNAIAIKKPSVAVCKTNRTTDITKCLLKEGLVWRVVPSHKHSPQQKLWIKLKYRGTHRIPVASRLRRVSRLSLRIYATHKDIPVIIGGLGLVILSTSTGIMTDRDARYKNLGGEILCYIRSL